MAHALFRFLREDGSESVKTWEAKLAKKYEDSLFKEFAVCDLKHYKNGNVRPNSHVLHYLCHFL